MRDEIYHWDKIKYSFTHGIEIDGDDGWCVI